MIYKNEILDLKTDITEKIGQKIIVKGSLGRTKSFEKEATIEKTYPMELIYKNNITNFVKNFNVILFKCTNIEYHKTTGKVSKLIFEQVEK